MSPYLHQLLASANQTKMIGLAEASHVVPVFLFSCREICYN